jgi:hypothetical protein
MASFADLQCCTYADIVGGSKKVQNYAEVIYGWYLMEQCNFKIIFFLEQNAVEKPESFKSHYDAKQSGSSHFSVLLKKKKKKIVSY